jgi:hypothetical protein
MKRIVSYPLPVLALKSEAMTALFRQLPSDAPFDLEMHTGQVLGVQMLGDRPCLIALMDQDGPKVTRRFRVLNSGAKVPDGLEYRVTWQDPQGWHWHLFEEPSSPEK